MNVYLLGHPVGHSLSPAIQNAAFRALGLAHVYTAVDVMPDDLVEQLQALRAADCLGANVTVPYKLAVTPALDAIDAEAQALGAVNTIVNSDGRLSGYNTDVDGAFEGLIVPAGDAIRGARLLVLGAGGGARAVLLALARAGDGGPASVVVVARRPAEAAAAAEVGADAGLAVSTAPWDELAEQLAAAAAVVNCTPLGLGGEDPLAGLPLAGRLVLDLAYRPGGTPLFRRAWEEGCIALQGEAMLLQQGALSFRLWTKQAAPLSAMRHALTAALA